MNIETTIRDGVEFATLPRAELNALLERLEDLNDIRAADAVRARVDRGLEEMIPAEYANRIIDGESPLKVFRSMRGLNQSELARRSGVNRVQIADIEAGRNTGSVETLKKLAAALNVTIDDLA